MKIVIYGTGASSGLFTSQVSNINAIEIEYYVETICSKERFYDKNVYNVDHILEDDYDYIVIPGEKYVNEMEATISNYGDKYIEKTLRENEFWSIYAHVDRKSKVCIPYESVKVSCGLEFIFRNGDMIGNCMIRSSKAFSEEDVDKFFSLSERFYGNDFLSDGYFIDCGANIGTTSIYVSKIKGKPVVSIECGEENYSLLEVNCLINNANNIICVKKALSDEKTELSYNYIDDNSGASFLSTKRESSEDRGYSQIVNTDTLGIGEAP